MMKFKSKEQKGVTVIALEGNVMGGPDATALNDQLHSLIDGKKTKVVVDLSKRGFYQQLRPGAAHRRVDGDAQSGRRIEACRSFEKN